MRRTFADVSKIRRAVGKQTITIQHALDPEIWLRNQTLYAAMYERHRAKVSVEGVALVIFGSALGIPGIGLLLLGCIRKKKSIGNRRGYVQLGPDFV